MTEIPQAFYDALPEVPDDAPPLRVWTWDELLEAVEREVQGEVEA